MVNHLLPGVGWWHEGGGRGCFVLKILAERIKNRYIDLPSATTALTSKLRLSAVSHSFKGAFLEYQAKSLATPATLAKERDEKPTRAGCHS